MKRLAFYILPAVLFLAACTPPQPAALTIMTTDSFSISESVAAAFEQANGVTLVFLHSGDAGAMLNKAILTRAAPLADIIYGVDNTFLSRALEADIIEPYPSPLLAEVSPEFALDPASRLLPVDYGDVCINYDKAWFAANSLPVPGSLEDLLQPEYNGLLVVENPATSSPGLAFLLATVAHFGDPGYLEFWAALRANGLVVVDGWDTAYFTNFSASSGQGAQPLVVSYGSSPVVEVIYAAGPLTEAPTGSILGPDACFRQVEFAGILRGTANRAMAEKFLDFMLGVQFQEDLPLQMFVYPVNPQAALPEVFVQFSEIPSQPASLPPEAIAANREAWIAAWTETVLR